MEGPKISLVDRPIIGGSQTRPLAAILNFVLFQAQDIWVAPVRNPSEYIQTKVCKRSCFFQASKESLFHIPVPLLYDTKTMFNFNNHIIYSLGCIHVSFNLQCLKLQEDAHVILINDWIIYSRSRSNFLRLGVSRSTALILER